MIYYIMIALLLYIIIGNIFFHKKPFYQKVHFPTFLTLNTLVLIWFIFQDIYTSRELIVLALDEITNILPKYFSTNLKIIILQWVFNLIYVILLISKRLKQDFL